MQFGGHVIKPPKKFGESLRQTVLNNDDANNDNRFKFLKCFFFFFFLNQSPIISFVYIKEKKNMRIDEHF